MPRRGPSGSACAASALDGAGDDGPVTLTFANGEKAEADVVIGADGIHSMVRAALTEPAPATYSGLCAFRALVPAEQAPAFARRPAQTLWLGPGHHLVHYPISAGRLGQPGRLRAGRRLHHRVVDRDRDGRGVPRGVRRLGRAAHRR